MHPAVERNLNDESVFVNPGEARTLSRETRRSRLVRTSTFQLRAVSPKLDTPLAIRRGFEASRLTEPQCSTFSLVRTSNDSKGYARLGCRICSRDPALRLKNGSVQDAFRR